jgi:hypothetical protein
MQTKAEPRLAVRPVLMPLRALFAVASLLVLLAAAQLFALSSRTDDFFAWTIAVPLTAAVDGAFYLSSFVLLLTAVWAQAWVQVRPLAWGVLTISTIKLVATLLHTSLFHFGAADLTPKIAAWGWLAVYVLVPIVLGTLIVVQTRLRGADPPVAAPMASAFRRSAGVMAGVLILVGVGLLLAPNATAERWPWPLTTLTAQAMSAWFLGVGVLVALHVRDGDAVRARRLWPAAVILCVLQGIALARYPDLFDWSSIAGVAYVALFVLVGAVGVWGVIASRGAADRSS